MESNLGFVLSVLGEIIHGFCLGGKYFAQEVGSGRCYGDGGSNREAYIPLQRGFES